MIGPRQDVQAVQRRLDGLEALVKQMTDTLDRTIHHIDKIEANDSRR